MTPVERSALRGLVAQQILFLCEKELGLKVDAGAVVQATEILVSKHQALSSRSPEHPHT